MPDMDAIAEKIAESQTKCAILKLFKENPYVMDNRFGLSLWVGRPEEMIIPELEELLDMGVLQRWGTEPGAIYAYTRDQDMRQAIDQRWDEICEKAAQQRYRDRESQRRGEV